MPSETTRDPLLCGECKGSSFSLFHLKPEGEPRVGGQGSGGFAGAIVAQCCTCGLETTIRAVPSRLDTDGPLCGGWRS